MIFDTDDLYEGHDRMDLLLELKAANPLFRCTAFAVVGRCPDAYIDSLPEWIEPVPHGWMHGDPPVDGGEWRDWTWGRTRELFDVVEDSNPRWARGVKGPGWIVSDEVYNAVLDAGWWIADHPDNTARRPEGIRTHVVGGSDHIHTHVQNVCGNGLEETFPRLLDAVKNASSFELVSECVAPWRPLVLSGYCDPGDEA